MKHSLEELERLASEATPGEWGTEARLPYAQKPRVLSREGFLVAEVGNGQIGRQDQWERDAEFIAAAREALPDLIQRERESEAQIATIERLTAENAVLRERAALAEGAIAGMERVVTSLQKVQRTRETTKSPPSG